MSLKVFDRWIGTTLFIPLIIKVCQASGQSQFAISRLLWFFVALDTLRLAETFGEQMIAIIFSVIMMLTASLRADMPAYSMMWFRLLAMVLLLLDLFRAIKTGEWKGTEIWALILFAEYAATIRTIPPKDVRKAKTRTARPAENRLNCSSSMFRNGSQL